MFKLLERNKNVKPFTVSKKSTRRLDLSNWTFDGRKLDNPIRIALRIVLLPIIYGVRGILYLLEWASWGKDDADNVWDNW